jgi:hypothetical protein
VGGVRLLLRDDERLVLRVVCFGKRFASQVRVSPCEGLLRKGRIDVLARGFVASCVCISVG